MVVLRAAAVGISPPAVTPRRMVLNSAGGNWMAAADRYLEECFAAGTPPHVNELAHQAGISPRSLRRAFTAEAHMGIASYFKHARIRRAQELLASSDLPLNDIACRAGFGTRVTFFRAFKRATGVTPDEFRAGRKTADNVERRRLAGRSTGGP